MQTLWQDLRFALRMLRKNPGFAAVAVLTLALGIGANTAIFSVVDAVLLQPLPYPESSRLLSITQTDRQSGATGIPVSFTKFTATHEQTKTLESVAVFFQMTPSLITERGAELINAARASNDFFHVLQVAPVLGRTFLPEEDAPNGNEVAILGDAFWHSHFAGDRGAIGKTLSLDGKNATIVGVLPPSFRFPLLYPVPDLWLPRVTDTPEARPDQIRSGAGYLSMIARLQPGETRARAEAELDTINSRYREQFGSYVDATKYVLAADSLADSIVGPLRPSLLVLLAAVGFVLLIACVNVANLLLARATAREREIAIRKALGASRARLVRQLLSESLLLSLGGGILGVWLAAGLMPVLRTFSPGAVPRLADAHVNGAALIFSLVLCVITGILFGLMPSLQAAGKELQTALKEGSRGSSEGGHRGRFRAVLVVAEVGMALVLMTGAGLLIESFARLMRVNPGFSSKNITTFPLILPGLRYPQAAQQEAFYRHLLERVRAIPQVQSAGVASPMPLSGGARFNFFCPEGRACLGIGKDPIIATRTVSAGYFETVRTPLLAGRVFTERDVTGGQNVAIINETTAKRYWPKQNPLGKHVANSRDMIPREIVGVVADVKFLALSAANTEEMYIPLAQGPWANMTLLVRSESNPHPLITAVREKISETDPNLPVSGILSMDNVIASSVAQPRLIMQFVGVFAGFALLLAAIGIYGVMAYTVNTRKQEMGIRVALGATSPDILRLVVGQGMRMTLIGIALGVAISLGLTRLLSSLLFGVQSTDPLVFSAAALVLVGAAFVACYLPARRATRVDPIIVLRYE
jgi:putative ABC transport system permease protein